MSSVAVPVFSLPRPSAAELRRHLEAELADRIPGALSPRERVLPEMVSSGIAALDELTGGWPLGTLSELFGPASSGRTSVLLAALAAATARGEACALIDAGDAFDPESAAGAGVDLKKLLWVRCGKTNSPPRRGGAEKYKNQKINIKNSSASLRLRVEDLGMPEPRDIGIWGYGDTETMERINPHLARKASSPRSHEGTKNERITSAPSARGICFLKEAADASEDLPPRDKSKNNSVFVSSCLRGEKKYRTAYVRIEQALKAADLLLAGGGFGLVAIDLAGLPPEAARRVPLTTWFRFRRTVEATSTVLLLVSPQPLTQSCAALSLRLDRLSSHDGRQLFRLPDSPIARSPDSFLSHAALLTGFRLRAEVIRSPAMRKPMRSARAEIETQAQWA
jgi:recombination protein RecA